MKKRNQADVQSMVFMSNAAGKYIWEGDIWAKMNLEAWLSREREAIPGRKHNKCKDPQGKNKFGMLEEYEESGWV